VLALMGVEFGQRTGEESVGGGGQHRGLNRECELTSRVLCPL
jgi:hypothetical protein